MKKLIIVLLLVFTETVYAATDYNCVSKCTEEGNTYQFCVKKCSYDTSTEQQPDKRIDYNCVTKCTQKGNMYQYCTEKCSY